MNRAHAFGEPQTAIAPPRRAARRSGGDFCGRGCDYCGAVVVAHRAIAAPARRNRPRGGFDETQSSYGSSRGDSFSRNKRGPVVIEGELVAKSTGATSEFSLGDRVFHQKFGYGQVVRIDGNKLTIAFEKAGEKKVVDSFVERV